MDDVSFGHDTNWYRYNGEKRRFIKNSKMEVPQQSAMIDPKAVTVSDDSDHILQAIEPHHMHNYAQPKDWFKMDRHLETEIFVVLVTIIFALCCLFVCSALCRKITRTVQRIQMKKYLNSDVTQIETNDDYHLEERASLIDNERV